jgi:hypothetical protein
MIATFTRAGLHFQYPENWTLTDEGLADWPRTVSVQSPGSAFWTVFQYEEGSPAALLEQALAEMNSQYENLESSAIDEEFDELEFSGFEMYFYCFDFLVCARALCGRAPDGKVYLVLWQAEDRDFAQMEAVFRAITTSLLREPPPPAGF